MADEDKQKRSAFVKDESIDKMNRTLRKESIVSDDQIAGGDDKSEALHYIFDSNQSIIKGKDFRLNNKPYIIGGTIDGDIKEPEVDVIKDAEGNVVKIKIKCICGREIDIDCVY